MYTLMKPIQPQPLLRPAQTPPCFHRKKAILEQRLTHFAPLAPNAPSDARTPARTIAP